MSARNINTNNAYMLHGLATILLIPSGGIVLAFSGKNLDIVQSPLMEITDSRFSQTLAMVRLLLYGVALFSVS